MTVTETFQGDDAEAFLELRALAGLTCDQDVVRLGLHHLARHYDLPATLFPLTYGATQPSLFEYVDEGGR
jgi:hypothetical protein